MKLFTTLLHIVAPHDCLGCGNEGSLLCVNCRATALIPAPSVCHRCKLPTENFRTCAACASLSDLGAVYPAVAYTGLARDIVWRLKFHRTADAATEMAVVMTAQCRRAAQIATGPVLVSAVPTATSRVRQRGYDQAILLAVALAAACHLPRRNLLARVGQHEQVGASRHARVRQLDQAFRLVRPGLIPGATILLVDDVITTGSTVEAAAGLLRRAGAAQVMAVVFARA